MILLRAISALFLLAVLYWVVLLTCVGIGQSADLRATWLAGEFFAQGDPGLIYRQSGALFTMEPPAAWVEKTLAEGKQIPVYPFIYPPLWGWIGSHVSGLVDYDTFVAMASLVNRILVPLMFVLAWRILKPKMSLMTYLGISLGLVAFLIPFGLALRENQPQIMVSFLILLAIERQRAGWNIAGGAALALAASIKLYPALFALLWLAAGKRSAVISFVLTGGALGLMSLAAAPWEFHRAMLDEHAAIARTAIVSTANFSFAPLVASLTTSDADLLWFTTEATGGNSRWQLALKSETLRLAEVTLQAVTLAGLLYMAFVTRMREPLLWAGAALAVAWVSPLSWTYHYLTVLVFLPVFIERLKWRGAALALLCILPTAWPFVSFPVTGELSKPVYLLFANGGLIILAASIFALALPRPTPLHPEAQSL